MTDASVVTEPDLIVRREGVAGIIRLNRPKAINAMTLEMSEGIDRALDQFEADPAVALVLLEGAGERGLCAGGDIRALWESSKVNGDLGKILWREEYILNARIKTFPKPYVAFMDGIVMGGGVGISAHASHRIVTERSTVAMPEVGIGFAPDVGGSWLLARAPGELGTHVALTAGRLGAADAILTVSPQAEAEQIERLNKALDAAGVRYQAEVYAGAPHGYTQADFAAIGRYSPEGTERHYRDLLALFDRNLH